MSVTLRLLENSDIKNKGEKHDFFQIKKLVIALSK